MSTAVPPDDTPSVTNLDFMTALFRDAPKDTRGHITSFIVDPDSLSGNPGKSGELWRGNSLPLPLKECPPQVSNAGFNNYVAMGIYNSHNRRKENVVGVCSIFIDDIGTKGSKINPADLPLPLSWLLETAPNNYQGGYFLKNPCDVDLDKATHINSELASMHGDKGVKDLSRYLRLPVGRNTKAQVWRAFSTGAALPRF